MKIQNLESLAGLKQNQLLSFCNKQRDKSIVLMPAGVASQNVTKYLQYHNIDIAYFVDNNPHKQNTSLLTKKIVSFESFLEDNNAVLLIASNLCFSEQIEKQCLVSKLTDYHIVKEDYVCFSPYEIDNAFELIKQKFPAYLAVYDLFEDELSRLTFLNRLKYLITYNPEYLAEIARPLVNQYFESDIYRVSEKDCFVDCGAYTGDTLTALLSFTGGRLAGYYGFEPDIKNYTALKQKTELVRGAPPGVEKYNAGVFSKNTKVEFTATNNEASKITKTTTKTTSASLLDVYAIDDILCGKKATFIKMDIEGAEIDALTGAQKIIKKEHPALAISVYHKFYDIIDIPSLISSYGVRYKYFLRHYTHNAQETVFYAVKL